MRDIFDTSRADRLTIARFVDTSMIDIEMANKMIYRVWEDNFGARKQQSISAEEAEDMGHIILAACNLISGAIRDYNFTLGRYEEFDLKHFTEYANRVIKTAEAEKTFDEAIAAGCHEAVKKACDMDNEEAVAVLNAAIARKKTIVCLSKGAESEATA